MEDRTATRVQKGERRGYRVLVVVRAAVVQWLAGSPVGQVRVALLIRPLSCLGARQTQAHACVRCVGGLAVRLLLPLLASMWTHLRSRLTGCGLPRAQDT
ncbi:hypothetical protein EYF80_003790 [Liparis tanakae]|uniref:Uncharacterized protein n=1 Tax=Liparis tanakae TaxID=230148 RepID=A0A4Z2J6X8_9TELE|nr:hypothetical protein EYF80_003790 [Liparis tanakae]